jgi:GTP cyclohydrolase I
MTEGLYPPPGGWPSPYPSGGYTPGMPLSSPSDAADDPLVAIAGALLDEVSPGWRDNPHMQKTPIRYAKWWREFTDYDPGNMGTVFPVQHVDQMVVVSGIEVWSLCAHHLLPFNATVSIGYLADESVLGLSKFARIAHEAAHRPTSQEEMCARIADQVSALAGTADVAVKASGTHLCMAMRGIKTPHTMTTSVARGRFRDQPETRAEWFALIGG